jgi:hypothetical protein
VIAGTAKVEFLSERSCVVEILLARYPVKQGKSDRMTFGNFYTREVVRTLEHNDRRITSGGGGFYHANE